MDILLVSPDYNNKKNNFPWGILALGSYLTNIKNYKVEFLDASVYSKAIFYERLKYACKNTRLVGISMMSTDAHQMKQPIDFIKENFPCVKIIIGGSHAMLEPEQTCLYKNIDFVAYSEGEYTLSMLIEEINSGREQYNNVVGLIYKDGNKIRRTTPPNPVPFYDINYGLLPESTKRTLPEYIQVLTGRGCSFKCSFCFNSVCGQKWRGRPIIDVMDELEKISNKYNSKIVYFRDENFFHSKERVKEFIYYYREKNFNFKWRANCHTSFFNNKDEDSDFLRDLESINCQMLKFGVESGSQRVLNYLKKGNNIENIKDLIVRLSKLRTIKANYSFMIGIPNETPEEYKDTLSLIGFIGKHDSSAMIVGPQYFRIYPGGELYEDIIKKYNFQKPHSFEEWANAFSPSLDYTRFSKNIDYPWIPKKYRFFTKHVDTLVLFYQQDLKKYLKIRLIPHVFFILIAKFRVNHSYYKFMFEIWLAVFLRKIKQGLALTFL